MDYIYLIMLLALVEYIVFIMIVGATRGKYGIVPPATTGHETWERLHRIQVNTAEQLVLFIPALYFFSVYSSETWAQVLGCVYLVGRLVYFFAYKNNPEKRVMGMAMTTLPSYIMVVGAIVGVVKKLL